jgi:hypothetical protein
MKPKRRSEALRKFLNDDRTCDHHRWASIYVALQLRMGLEDEDALAALAMTANQRELGGATAAAIARRLGAHRDLRPDPHAAGSGSGRSRRALVNIGPPSAALWPTAERAAPLELRHHPRHPILADVGVHLHTTWKG